MNPLLWTWREICCALSIPEEDGPDLHGVTVDSRLAQAGDLFIALPGDPGPRFNPSYRSNIDGHDFVHQARSAGCAGAIVHRPIDIGKDDSFAIATVADTYDGLWALGQAASQRLTGTKFAITGSSGKTTAKTFLAAATGAYAPPGSFNNHIGVPLSLSNTPRDADCAVYEIGTNHPGEIAPLAKMVQPDIAILLNVQNAHIENFDNWQALREEKISIFSGLEDKTKAVSNYDLRLDFGYTFGWDSQADAHITDYAGDKIRINLMGEEISAHVPGGGRHRASTLCAVVLAVKLADGDVTQACHLSHDLIPAGRGNIETISSIRVYDDSYNANPSSMQAAIDTLLEIDAAPGRRIAVIGEMAELGDVGEQAHLSLAAALKSLDEVFCVGDATKALAAAIGADWSPRADEMLTQKLVECLEADDHVLIKGSNGVFWQHQYVKNLKQEIMSK